MNFCQHPEPINFTSKLNTMESGDSHLVNCGYLLYFIGNELVIELKPDIPEPHFRQACKNSVYAYWNSFLHPPFQIQSSHSFPQKYPSDVQLSELDNHSARFWRYNRWSKVTSPLKKAELLLFFVFPVLLGIFWYLAGMRDKPNCFFWEHTL